MKDFTERLTRLLANFNEEEAYALSREIHEYEAVGGVITATEDALWLELTMHSMYFDLN
jgi:hypothetical protein